MGWRNLAQITTSNIPQNMITDPDAFVSAFASATTGQQRDQVCAQYVFPTWNGIKANLLTAGKIAGDNTNYIELIIPSTAWRARSYYNGSQLNYTQESWANTDYAVCYVALVNDETQKGWFSTFIRYRDGQGCSTASGAIPPGDSTIQSRMYTILTGNPLITYTWKSIPQVSGKMGTFLFTTIDDNYLNNGDPVDNVNDPSFIHFNNQTEIGNMIANQATDTEVDKIYAGKVDKMTFNIDPPNTWIQFYMAGGSTPFYRVSRYGEYIGAVTIKEVYLSFLIDEENQVAKPSFVIGYESAGFTIYTFNNENPSTTEMEQLYLWFRSHIDDESDDPGIIDDDPTDGINPWDDEPIEGLTVPGKSAIDTGFTKMYEVSDSELKNLAAFLWSDNFLDNVKKFFSDPKEIIVGISIMPIKPTVGSSQHIKAGGIDTGISGLPLLSQYKLEEDLGEIYIQRATDSFLDYPPYTKIVAHLPYVGDHSLDVNKIMGKTLKLKYLFDFLTGSCVAEIDVNGKPTYFFGGSCGLQIPISAENFTKVFSSILSAGATLGATMATVASGGLTAPMLISSAANTVQNSMSMTPDVQYNSGNGSINGMLTTQSCYITIEHPEAALAENQASYTGRTSLSEKTLSSCHGFTKCFKVHLDGINCYDAERSEIESLLMNGVRIESGSETPDYTPSASGNFGIYLMKLSSDKDVIGKTWTDQTLIEGKLFYGQNVMNPKILLQGNYIEYSYVYIDAFKRFYYINSVTAESNNQVTIDLSVDVLQSFASSILNCKAVVERQQSKYNKELNDSYYFTKQQKLVPFSNFKKLANPVSFDRNNNTFILTIAGGE